MARCAAHAPCCRRALPGAGHLIGGGLHSVWLSAGGGGGHSGDPGLVFPWWSFTKTVIAVCALRAAERGRLDLDAVQQGFS
ncbi:serine hydrolase, partial [Oceanicola sp. S124]|uniref:serine hydrolase n=1 Tax=Oceanicola sp. S124 TaxID=1042378 RepID=UPI000255827E